MFPTHEREIRAITRNRTETDILQKRLGKLERAKTELNLSRHYQTTSVRRFLTQCQRTSGYGSGNIIDSDSNDKLIGNRSAPPLSKSAQTCFGMGMGRGVRFARGDSGQEDGIPGDELRQKTGVAPYKSNTLIHKRLDRVDSGCGTSCSTSSYDSDDKIDDVLNWRLKTPANAKTVANKLPVAQRSRGVATRGQQSSIDAVPAPSPSPSGQKRNEITTLTLQTTPMSPRKYLKPDSRYIVDRFMVRRKLLIRRQTYPDFPLFVNNSEGVVRVPSAISRTRIKSELSKMEGTPQGPTLERNHGQDARQYMRKRIDTFLGSIDYLCQQLEETPKTTPRN
ncbi:uncharacterized protein LOC135498148 [Lineus longissimus]|uniref:uncharacterized protein LOC135498148 n=1 Tax=Lineus longissimus TaxID=88925 RepID=UPI00315CD061